MTNNKDNNYTIETEQYSDSIIVRCDSCGKILSSSDKEDYGNECYSCIHQETAGLIDDEYKELDFSDDGC